jgi:hypothetical protein
MKRPASGERNLERIQRWREACPEIVIRSTFIAGFPGETEAEFEHLLDFMREAQIDRAGCFAYSGGRGRGQRLPGMLPLELREERRARFMAVAEEVSAAKLRAAWAPPCRCWWTGARAGPQGRRRAQLCRCARDRRHGETCCRPRKSARRSRWANSPAPASWHCRATTSWHCLSE